MFCTKAHAAWGCPVWLGERALRLAPCAPQPLPPLILSGSSSAFECLPHVYVLISTRANTWVGPPADLSSSRSVQLVPLCDSNPKTLAVFAPWTLSSAFAIHGVQEALHELPLLVLRPGNSLKSVSSGSQGRISSVSGLSMVTVLHRLVVFCQLLLHIFCLFYLLFQLGGGVVNLAPYSILARRQSPIIYLKKLFQKILLV